MVPSSFFSLELLAQVGIHDDGDGTVVDEGHLHVCAEGARLHLAAEEFLESGDETLVERHGDVGFITPWASSKMRILTTFWQRYSMSSSESSSQMPTRIMRPGPMAAFRVPAMDTEAWDTRWMTILI